MQSARRLVLNKIKSFMKKNIRLVFKEIEQNRKSRNIFWRILNIIKDICSKIKFNRSLKAIFEPFHLGGYIAGGDPAARARTPSPSTPSSAMSMDSSRTTPTDTVEGLNAPSVILLTMNTNLLTANNPINWC